MDKSHSKDEVDEDSGDEEDESSSDEAMEMTPEKRAHHAITGRGVTLSMLLADGIIETGKGILSIQYLGRKFVADLMPNGKIKTTDATYNSPSAWAIHCKKLVNPNKKSGCGWASVKYKGKKLDAWKTSWFRQQRLKNGSPQIKQPSCYANKDLNGDTDSRDSNETGISDTTETAHLMHSSTPVSNGNQDGASRLTPTWDPNEEQEEALNLSLKGPYPSETKDSHPKAKEVLCIKYTDLQKKDIQIEPSTLVECGTFDSLERIQPFTVSMTTNSMLLVDLHCHLTTSEVVGYLAGRWDQNMQHLSILQAFPCRCRLGDKSKSVLIEEEIRQTIDRVGLTLVGWYHSHPRCFANPSIRDINSQMAYQLKMKGANGMYYPCVGLIVSPYVKNTQKSESTFRAFLVMPPIGSSTSDYSIPMEMRFSMTHDTVLSQELLTEMKRLVEFYYGAPDLIRIKDKWQNNETYLDKIKMSLKKRLPKDNRTGQVLDAILGLLSLK